MNNSWPLVPLGEVLKPISRPEMVDPEKTYRILGAHWYAKGLYVKDTLTGSGIRADKVYRVQQGDFVYNRLFAWKGSFAVASEEHEGCYVSNEFPCFTLSWDRADGNYLWKYFSRSSAWDDALELSSGGTPTSRNRLKEDKFLAMKISLPSLSEQRRIVARIDELAAKIDEARGLRRQTIEEVEAVVKSVAREVLSEVNVPITNLGSWLDGEREGIQTGPFGAQLGSTDFTESGTPVLTIGNIQYDGLHLDSLKRVSEEKAAQLERYRIKMGDVLFARMGTVGRCCIVPSEAEGWLINYHIIRVALDKQRVEPRYIHWTIQASAEVEDYLDEKIRGATRQGVNSTIVRALPCRVPLVSEQRRIVAYLDNLQAKVDTLEQFQGETAAELDAMLPSILDKAFRGAL